MGVVDVDIHVSSHLKEELALTIDKKVISTVMWSKNSKSTEELKAF